MADANKQSWLSKRTLTWAVAGVLALGGGWYFFFNDSPQAAVAMPDVKKPTKGQLPANKVAPVKKKEPPSDKVVEAKPMPSTRPAPAPVATSSNSSKPAPPAKLAAAPATVVQMPTLGATYRDDVHGFTIKFPTRWPLHTFDGEPWILDCGDTRVGLISIGFSPCPAEITADKLLPEAIARRIKKRQNTTLHSQGRTELGGKKALWSKSTGPLPMSNADPMMTRVQYIVPLQDGRVLEIRVAAPPDKFNFVAGLMKQSLDTFHVLPKSQRVQVASSKLD
jgi:hypothetical protein